MINFPSAFLATVAALAAASTALAGPTSASQAPVPPPESAESSGLEIEAAIGYDSHYIFRGELLQKNTPWAQLSLTVPLTESLFFAVTPWYLHDMDDDYNEFDLNAGFLLSFGKYEFGLGYAGYYYPQGSLGAGEGIDDEQEMIFSVSRDVGPASVTVMGTYSFTREAFYYELAAELPYQLNDVVTIQPGVALGWDSDYFAEGTGFNHLMLSLSFPLKLSEHVELTPYIAGNFPFAQLGELDDDLYGGVKLTVGF